MGFSQAYGAVLGAFVGDASGAPLEFANRITTELVDQAMHMKGGGILNIGSGQVTDDSEMAMCQLQALHKQSAVDHHPSIHDDLLSWYRKWAQSKPFDIGGTTSQALAVDQHLELNDHYQRVKDVNWSSKANGGLMRLTPLIVWTRNLGDDIKLNVLSGDTQLTHPNPSCVHASHAYGLAIHSLINHPKDVDLAMEAVGDYFKNKDTEVATWVLEDTMIEPEDLHVTTNIGFVRWATTLAFHFLQQYTPYEDAIRQTLMLGGDTDTNAAIVGGMMGALHGVDTIPDYMKEPVLNYQYSSDTGVGYDRPDFLMVSHLPGLMNQMYHNS